MILGTTLLLTACAQDPPPRDACGPGACDDAGDDAQDASAGDTPDAGAADARDSGGLDARDAGATDAGGDAATREGGRDDGPAMDAARDASTDAAAVDAALDVPADVRTDVAVDTATDVVADAPRDVAVDAPRDAATAGCVSGATGNYVVRFRWAGSGPGSTAYVQYEANTLPDTSRWRVSAASTSIGYTPVYDDTFLGPGGLDLEGTTFIDVQLSTAGLSAINGVTLAIFGRSFNTTASGSFSWRTFTGRGAAPTNLVANSAPYEWYGADATMQFVPGDSGVLLRIYPGPASDALIVNRVEVCFDAR